MSEELQRKTEEIDVSAIEIRSEEVQEIMGFIPHWIIRWGITVIFIVITIFLIGSYFFKYPDVIMSSIVVTTETPPAAIVARTSGKIKHLFVQDNQEIKADGIIGILDNASDYQHLLDLKSRLEQLKPLSPHYDPSGELIFGKSYALGELQSIYSGFLKTYQDYRYFIRLGYHKKKIEAYKLQLSRHRLVHKKMERQTAIIEQEFELSKQQYDRILALFKDGIVSQKEMDTGKASFLQKEYSLEGARSNLANQKIQLSQLEQSIMDLRLQYTERKTQLELSLNQAYNNLAGQIAQWEQNYVLRTPISGMVTFTKFWSTNQNVRVGDTVFTVVPKDAGKMLGKVVLPIRGSGKVEVGQAVNIKFFNYPHIDFGMVRGRVKSKSLVTSDNNYVLEVELPEGLMTNYKQALPFNQEMQGTAEIITDDIRLLERLFKPLKSLLSRK